MIRAFLFCLILLLNGCTSGFMLIERSERLPEESSSLKAGNILFLEPEARQVEIVNSIHSNTGASAKLQQQFEQYLLRSARKNNLQIQIRSIENLAANDLHRYSQLMALRTHVLQANSQQGHSPDRNSRLFSDGLQERLMASSPQLFPEFSGLQGITGTPYVAFSGWTNIDSREITQEGRARVSDSFSEAGHNSIFYLDVVNLETSQVIYRELKRVEGPANKSVFFTSLYDSFFLFRKHLGRS